MGRAARRHRDNGFNENGSADNPAIGGSWSLSPGTMLGGIVVGMAVLIFLGFLNWGLTRQIQGSLDNRLTHIETRLAQISTKVDQVGSRAPSGGNQSLDPNRVYTVKIDGAPVRGPQTAPVTIAEFSDFQ